MKLMLDNLGFSNVWSDFNPNINYLPLLKQRVHVQFIQTSIYSMSKLEVCYI